jgi:glycosyltransferase involved in cell wall biosynthesis
VPDGKDAGPRVLLVGKAAPERGGIPSSLEMLLERLPGHGVDVELLNLADAEPRAGGSVSLDNVTATLRDLVRVARAAGRFDVVHVHSAAAPGATLVRAGSLCVAARLRRARTVLHVHGGLLADWLEGPRRRRAARLALAAADEVVAVASGPAAVLSEALGRPVPVIANGVDLDRFHPGGAPSPEGPPTVLMVGSLTPRKGVLDLLEASRELRGRGVRHRLVLAGGTPDDGSETQHAVVAAVEAAGPDVTVLRSIANRDMPEHYRRADVFCLPSWWEAQPLSVLEAMACGLPAVVADVGDVRAMVGDAAVVVAARDVVALTEALGDLLGDATRRRSLGAAARRHVEAGRGVDEVVAQVAALYTAVGARDTARSGAP